MKCNHYFCFECLKGEVSSWSDLKNMTTRGTMISSLHDGSFPCPVCRKKCTLFERIQRPTTPSPTLSPEPEGGPFRNVSVEEADGTVATWLANYCSVQAFTGLAPYINPDNLDTLEKLQEHQTIFQFGLFAARDELEKAWKRVATVHKTPEAIAEAFKWDRDVEDARAVLRHADARVTGCQKSISRVTRQQIGSGVSFGVQSDVWVCGVVTRPEYNGLEGKITAVLPPKTDGNKSDVTRYRVALSVGSIELSLRAENLRLTSAANQLISQIATLFQF